MEKNLNLTIRLIDDETFAVDFYEPETGSFNSVTCYDSGYAYHDEWQSDNNRIAGEIRFWVENMRETAAENKEERR